MISIRVPNTRPARRSRTHLRMAPVLAALAVTGFLAGCNDGDDGVAINIKPGFIGAVTRAAYDGAVGDLLAADLGKTGLAGASGAIKLRRAGSPGTAPTPR